MNPATAFSVVLVDELIRGGVEHAVLAPGSRSGPVALALAAAERSGRLQLHVRTDERSAGFLALGLAKGSGRPVPVLTTSGTATAHLHAAVLEASYSGVPLIALTADRPPELRGIGANQTIEQAGLYGGAVRYSTDVDVPERAIGCNDRWRSLVCLALARARGLGDRRPGAVHLNLPLREPLLPGPAVPPDSPPRDSQSPDPQSLDSPPPDSPWPESLAGRDDGAPWTQAVSTGADRDRVPDADADADAEADADADSDADAGTAELRDVPTWLVLGDCAAEISAAAVAVAARHRWPVLAEPSGNAGTAAVPAYLGLLESEAFLARHRPEQVICVGRPTLSRAMQRLLHHEDVRVERYEFGPQWPGRSRSIDELTARVPGTADGTALIETLAEAGDRLLRYQDQVTDEAYLGGARTARDLVCRLPDGARLFLGSSTPIRDVDRYAHPRDGVQMLANRGVAGIDGSTSTAVGIALSTPDRPCFALIGDLAFLHDLGGLAVVEAEPAPNLTLVVVDNRGGGLFAQLEPGEPAFERDYDRVFGTPHRLDLVEVARSLGWPAEVVTDPGHLADALGRGGPRVIVIRTDQRADAEILRRIRSGSGRVILPS